MTERVIAEAAAQGRVVLVGRGAQAVLAQRPDALHVYVVASRPWRRRLAVERLGLDAADAGKIVDETDRRRDDYVTAYYGRARQDLSNYDVVVNAEKVVLTGKKETAKEYMSYSGWKGGEKYATVEQVRAKSARKESA